MQMRDTMDENAFLSLEIAADIRGTFHPTASLKR